MKGDYKEELTTLFTNNADYVKEALKLFCNAASTTKQIGDNNEDNTGNGIGKAVKRFKEKMKKHLKT